jgi:hypothetical protein
MRMPPLVRFGDSVIEMIEFVIAELSNCLDHARRVREQVRARKVAIDHSAPEPEFVRT